MTSCRICISLGSILIASKTFSHVTFAGTARPLTNTTIHHLKNQLLLLKSKSTLFSNSHVQITNKTFLQLPATNSQRLISPSDLPINSQNHWLHLNLNFLCSKIWRFPGPLKTLQRFNLFRSSPGMCIRQPPVRHWQQKIHQLIETTANSYVWPLGRTCNSKALYNNTIICGLRLIYLSQPQILQSSWFTYKVSRMTKVTEYYDWSMNHH